MSWYLFLLFQDDEEEILEDEYVLCNFIKGMVLWEFGKLDEVCIFFEFVRYLKLDIFCFF